MTNEVSRTTVTGLQSGQYTQASYVYTLMLRLRKIKIQKGTVGGMGVAQILRWKVTLARRDSRCGGVFGNFNIFMNNTLYKFPVHNIRIFKIYYTVQLKLYKLMHIHGVIISR